MRRTFLRSTIHLVIGVALLMVAASWDANRAMKAWADSPVKPLFSNAYVSPEGPNGVGVRSCISAPAPCRRWSDTPTLLTKP